LSAFTAQPGGKRKDWALTPSQVLPKAWREEGYTPLEKQETGLSSDRQPRETAKSKGSRRGRDAPSVACTETPDLLSP
jgi:hypothetical protein